MEDPRIRKFAKFLINHAQTSLTRHHQSLHLQKLAHQRHQVHLRLVHHQKKALQLNKILHETRNPGLRVF